MSRGKINAARGSFRPPDFCTSAAGIVHIKHLCLTAPLPSLATPHHIPSPAQGFPRVSRGRIVSQRVLEAVCGTAGLGETAILRDRTMRIGRVLSTQALSGEVGGEELCSRS